MPSAASHKGGKISNAFKTMQGSWPGTPELSQGGALVRVYSILQLGYVNIVLLEGTPNLAHKIDIRISTRSYYITIVLYIYMYKRVNIA